MRKIHCINAISKYGTDQFTEDYQLTDEINEAEGILVRSASLHEMQFSNSLLAIARAGAGVNNIPLDACAQEGIVVFNTPGANANGVKELVLAGLFLASRNIVGGIEWCKENKEDANIAKSAEKAKKAFAGCEIKGKKLGVVGLVPLVLRLPIQPLLWVWKFTAMIRTFLLMRHGDCLVM